MRRLFFISVALAALAAAPAHAAPAGLDAGFGTDGVAKITFATPEGVANGFQFFETAEGVATAPGGKIVVVGEVAHYNPVTDVGGTDFGIARLNPDGSLDETFGSGGKRVIDFKPTGSDSWEDRAKDVVVQPDGKIVVAGQSEEESTLTSLMTVTRLNASDGSTDMTFGNPVTPGVHHIGLGDNGTVEGALARFANGRFMLAGTVYADTATDMGWAGLNHLGQEDPPISDTLSFQAGSVDRAGDVATTPDGNFVMAGHTRATIDTPENDIAVARRSGTNGAQDNSFNGNGRTTINLGGDDAAEAVAVQPDGRVLTAGGSSRPGIGLDFFVHRLTALGASDASFGNPGNNGAAFIDFGGSERAVGLTVLPDGKLAVAGVKSAGPGGDVAVARLTAGGALDASFGVGGKRVIELPGPQDPFALAVQPDGGFLVAGRTPDSASSSTSDFFVMRIGKFTPRRGPAGTSPRPAAPGLAKVAISAKSLKASAKGVVAVKVRCSAAAACRGTVDLTTARKVSVSAKKRKLKLARKSYSVAAGRSKTVKLKLRRSGLKLLRKRRKLRVRLTVTTRRAGAKAAKVVRTVTLSAARKKKGKR